MELTRLNIARAVLMFDVKHIEADVPPLCHISMNIPLMVHAPMGKGLLYMGTNRMRTLQFFAILLRLSFLESLLLKPLPIRRSRTTMPLFDSVNQSKDALRILVDFHEGTWTGKATSFSITNDLSAGIRMRKVSPEYKSTIKVGLDLRNQEYTMTETLEWESKMKRRQLSLIEASMDVDTVDGSYSLDTSLPDLPEDLIGTKKILQFGIEHCIAVNDNARVRAFAFYGIDQSLARIVICLEERFLEAANPLTMETIRPSTSSSSVVLSPAPINILELTSENRQHIRSQRASIEQVRVDRQKHNNSPAGLSEYRKLRFSGSGTWTSPFKNWCQLESHLVYACQRKWQFLYRE